MKRITSLLVCLLLFGFTAIFAQDIQIKGTVTTAEDGSPLPGAYVKIKGTNTGTATDADGKYQLTAPSNATLVFTSIGYQDQEIVLAGQSVLDVVMSADVTQVDEVVVTALGISRERKSLGYATQEVKGDAISAVKTDNFVNSLSGKVAGVVVTRNTNMGGSTNIQVRGATSLTGNNQALFVVDGVPISNRNTNTAGQAQDGTGYDFGNAASDINPDDIESINVLKGAAATALYGSRASTGVVMITTKKGSQGKKGIGITVNSNFTLSSIDKSTFPEYQNKYGAGYGHYYSGDGNYWYLRDLNNDGTDEQWVVTSEDASYGAPFDPNLLVYQWNAVDPESPLYMTPTPWVAAKDGPISFFNKGQTYTNSVAVENSFDKGNYRLSYTNYKNLGIIPNSSLKRNNILMNGTWKVNNKLTVQGSANYILTQGKGRNSTGYNDNYMGSWRQWFQTNVDIQQQKDMYFRTHRNVSWNYADPSASITDLPIFWDNPYWLAYENYETDSRSRFIGYMTVDYKLTDWLDIFGRAATDFYSALEEERKAVGTVPGRWGLGTGADGSTGQQDGVPSGYLRRDYYSAQNNFDIMLNINKDLTEDLNLKAILGMNINRNIFNRTIMATNGGLAIPRLYSIQNSYEAVPYPRELASKVGIDGLYASASLGYKNFLFLDGTIRRDHSSTLPKDNSVYYYPSVSGSVIFSELIKQQWLSFGKIRLNYAQVGAGTGFDQLQDSYSIQTPFNSPISATQTTKKNPNLKPEKTNSLEGGLEMYFFNRRAGFDLALYKTNTTDQIMPLAVSTATGYFYKIINAGEIENKGIELALNFVPVKTSNFTWDLSINWSKNVNKVISLYTDPISGNEITNLQLGSFQGGVSINARVGQPYGIIEGIDYTYLNGQKVINPANGRYIKTSTSDNNLGKVAPDWKGGILNTFTYKNWRLSGLIDISKGGHVWSLDMYYGLATGLYPETAGNNDLGNPVRDPVVMNVPGDPTQGYADNSGGFINEGVNPNGEKNITRIAASNYGSFGYLRIPDKAFSYDASYVKLREVSISYGIPSALLQKFFIKGIDLSIVGSNLWIISKHLPYADPESGLGAGNLMGYSTGSLPTTRDIGFNIKLTF
jgi:TonB-linked SusC/RagA family outer membrane protein